MPPETAAFKDHFSGHAKTYAQFRPDYPDALFAWLAQVAPARERAWDCATGNGQAALQLSAYFRNVVATDASAEQIARAPGRPGIEWRVEPAEITSLSAASVDLVTVAQALHWFDHARFLAEVQRVCRPGAVVAAWCYALAQVTPEIDSVIQNFYENVVGPHWPPERRLLERGYQDIPWPYAPLAAPEFAMSADWSLERMVGYLGTWSAVQRYARARGEDPLPQLLPELRAAWGDPRTVRTVRWPLALRVGRVS